MGQGNGPDCMEPATARHSAAITMCIIPDTYVGIGLDGVCGLIDSSLFSLWKINLPATTFSFSYTAFWCLYKRGIENEKLISGPSIQNPSLPCLQIKQLFLVTTM